MAKKINSLSLSLSGPTVAPIIVTDAEPTPIVDIAPEVDKEAPEDLPVTLADLASWTRSQISAVGAVNTDEILAFVVEHANNPRNVEIRALHVDVKRASGSFRTGQYTGCPESIALRYSMRKITEAQFGNVVRVPTLNAKTTAGVRGLTPETMPPATKFAAGFRPGLLMDAGVFNSCGAYVRPYLATFDNPRTDASTVPAFDNRDTDGKVTPGENPAGALRLAEWGTKAPYAYLGTRKCSENALVLKLEHDLSDYQERAPRANQSAELEALKAECVTYRATIADLEAQIATYKARLANVDA